MKRWFQSSLCLASFACCGGVAFGEQHEIYRNRATFQTDPTTLTPLVFQGGINVFRDEPDQVSSVFASNPGALFEAELSRPATPNLFGERFEYRTPDFDSLEALEAMLPYGDYELSLTRADGLEFFATLSDDMPRFTNIPLFRNYEDFDAFDPSLPFTVEWDAMFGGTALALQIFGEDGFFYVDRYDLSATSGVIPADTLAPGRRYVFSLVFQYSTIVDDDGFEGASLGQVFYQHFTQAEFFTVPEPSAIALLAIVGLAAPRRRR